MQINILFAIPLVVNFRQYTGNKPLIFWYVTALNTVFIKKFKNAIDGPHAIFAQYKLRSILVSNETCIRLDNEV